MSYTIYLDDGTGAKQIFYDLSRRFILGINFHLYQTKIIMYAIKHSTIFKLGSQGPKSLCQRAFLLFIFDNVDSRVNHIWCLPKSVR